MLISPSKQTVSCVKHIIDIPSFFVPYTDLGISLDIYDSCKFHVTSKELKRCKSKRLKTTCIIDHKIAKQQKHRKEINLCK